MKKILIFFWLIFIANNFCFCQALSVKSNAYQLVLARPSFDIVYNIDNKNAIALHWSSGKTFWLKENEDQVRYRFQTLTFDYFYNLNNNNENDFQISTLFYTGIIERKVFREELASASFALPYTYYKGKDFFGKAFRLGAGCSVINKINSRISIENNIGFGIGFYYNESDVYYKNINSNRKQYFDFRMALNLCYKIL